MSSDVAVSYTVVFEEVGDGWIQARLHELPAVITAAPSREQAAEDVVDALREYLLSLRDVLDQPKERATGHHRILRTAQVIEQGHHRHQV
jgi:hypothetical protein